MILPVCLSLCISNLLSDDDSDSRTTVRWLLHFETRPECEATEQNCPKCIPLNGQTLTLSVFGVFAAILKSSSVKFHPY